MTGEATNVVSYSLPLVTAFMGFASSQVLEWLKDHRAYQRERDKRDYERRNRQLEERNQFQSQTLLELQETVVKVVRTIAHLYYLDVVNDLSNQKWRGHDLPHDFGESALEATLRTKILGARVRDESIRESLKLLEAHRVEMLGAYDFSESTKTMKCVEKIHDDLNERIGEMLRNFEEVELAN